MCGEREMNYELGVYEKFCISPRKAIDKETKSFSQMFSSHDWKIEYAKPYGCGLYVAFKCLNCDAIGHAVIEEVS
jgi:hypothetical protein